MSIARSTGAFVGTDESTGVTVSNNTTTTGSEVDVLGDNTSAGDIEVYVCLTGSGTTGTLDVTVVSNRTTGNTITKLYVDRQIAPTNGTQKLYLGRIPATRYMYGITKNNATGGNLTNVALLYELYKVT